MPLTTTFPTDHTLEIRKAGVLIQTMTSKQTMAGLPSARAVTIRHSIPENHWWCYDHHRYQLQWIKTVTVSATGNVKIN
jgi:hypothetical protein